MKVYVFIFICLGSTVPELSLEVKSAIPEKNWPFFAQFGGQSFPKEHLKIAHAEVEEFCNILRHEGVVVRRPEAMDYSKVNNKRITNKTNDICF